MLTWLKSAGVIVLGALPKLAFRLLRKVVFKNANLDARSDPQPRNPRKKVSKAA